MLAVLSACSKWNALQRWGLFFNPQILRDFFPNSIYNLIDEKLFFLGK